MFSRYWVGEGGGGGGGGERGGKRLVFTVRSIQKTSFCAYRTLTRASNLFDLVVSKLISVVKRNNRGPGCDELKCA